MIRIAHRSGAYGDLPEQTVTSAKLAMENGAAYVEIDTRFLRDGEIAISHDLSLERVYGTNKSTKDLTLDEFRGLRHKLHPESPSHTLRDYLEAGVEPLLIHIKEGGEERLARIIDLLKEYHYEDRAALGVQVPKDADFVKSYCQNIKVLAFMQIDKDAGETVDSAIEDYLATDADFIRLWEAWVTPERVGRIHDGEKQVWVMAANPEVGYTTKEKLDWFSSLGVDGVLLNEITFGKESV